MTAKEKTLNIVAKYSHLLIFLLLTVVMAFASDVFLSGGNLINLLRQPSLLLIMALGMTAAMLLGRGVDMSIDAILSMSLCIAAGFMRDSRTV